MIKYPFEIPPDKQHDLSETILFGDDLYRMLGDGIDHPHILPGGGVTIKYHPLLIAASNNNSTTSETTTIRRISIFARLRDLLNWKSRLVAVGLRSPVRLVAEAVSQPPETAT